MVKALTSSEEERAPVSKSVLVALCVCTEASLGSVCAQIGRKWSWERYRCVKAKTGFRGARPARWWVGVYKVFDTS